MLMSWLNQLIADNQSNNFPILLPLILGLPGRLTENVYVDLFLTSGTTGEIIWHHFKSGTTFRMSKVFYIECLIASKLPEVVYVNIPLVSIISSSKMETI